MGKFNYENKQYLAKLNALEDNFYFKYIAIVQRFSRNKKIKFLDVGCGSGTVLVELKTKGFTNLYGVDVSTLFIKNTKKRGIKNAYKYNGTTLPFNNNSFDIIGSFNVLEHTEEPEEYIKEEIRKIKKKGFLIVACPNFLNPILKTRHRRIHGIKNRTHNILRIFLKLTIKKDNNFERIKPLVRKHFEYDDDSIVVTNPIDLRRILKQNKCVIVYESGFIAMDTFISRIIDGVPILRYMMPSCFIVAQKK